MATSQRPLPPEPDSPPSSRPHLPDLAESHPPRSRRWRFAYLWILLAVGLLVWYVGFGWGDSGGWIWGDHGDVAAPADNADLSGPGVAFLEVANKQDYVGQPFVVANVPVDHWSGSRAVWIGSSHSYPPILVVLHSAFDNANPTTVASNPGPNGSASAASPQLLNITGTVIAAPSAAKAQQQWSLTQDDVDQLEQEGVCIQATSVSARH